MNPLKYLLAPMLTLAATISAALAPQAQAWEYKSWVVEYRQPEWRVKGFSHSLDGSDHRDAQAAAERFLEDKLRAGFEAYMDHHVAGTHAVIYDVHYRLLSWTSFYRFGSNITDKIKAVNAQATLERLGYEARVRFI